MICRLCMQTSGTSDAISRMAGTCPPVGCCTWNYINLLFHSPLLWYRGRVTALQAVVLGLFLGRVDLFQPSIMWNFGSYWIVVVILV